MNHRSNRLCGLFGRPPYLHVENASRIAALDEWEVRLLRLLAKTTIAEVRHHPDDFDRGLRVGSRALTDQHAKRVLPREISLDERLVDNRHACAGLSRRPGVALIEVPAG